MKRFLNIIRSKKGGSLVVTLMVLFLLLILSSSLLLLSTRNSRFGKNISKYSSKYYDLDKAAEQVLRDMDSCIEEAEFKTVEYMKDENFKENSFNQDCINPSIQKYFFRRWVEGVFLESGSFSKDEKKEYLKKLDALTKEELAKNVKVDNEKYNERMGKFNTETFGKIYYVYLQDTMKKYPRNKRINIEGKDIDVKFETVNNKEYSMLSEAVDWDEFKAEEGDTEFNLELKNPEGKKLKVVAKAKIPVYDSIKSKEIYKAMKGNPLFVNAITAGGSVKFSDGNIKVYGDIISTDNEETEIKTNSTEGVSITDAILNIYGNVYSRGDFQVFSSAPNKKSEVYINEYGNQVEIKDKKKIFNNNFFTELTDEDKKNLKAVLQENSRQTSKMDFVYYDDMGGNAYCNNLIMDKSAAKGSKINLSGSLSTKVSLINDSVYGGTEININRSYVGLTKVPKQSGRYSLSDSNGNYGSCIVNNIYDLNNINKISIKEKVAVPGVKPIELSTGSYPSAESVSANIWTKDKINECYRMEKYKDMFPLANVKAKFRQVVDNKGVKTAKEVLVDSKLMDTVDSSKSTYAYTIYTNDIKDGEYLKNITTGIEFGIENPQRNVFLGFLEGPGAVLKPSSGRYKLLDYNNSESVNNRYAFEKAEKYINKIFDKKTLRFGTENFTFDSALDVSKVAGKDINETGITYFDSNGGTINLDKDKSGIVYSEGDLNIEGNKTFKGTIICRGTVTINGNASIRYDENVIKDILRKHELACDFFKPGEMGLYVLNTSTVVADESLRGRKKSATYNIVEWNVSK